MNEELNFEEEKSEALVDLDAGHEFTHKKIDMSGTPFKSFFKVSESYDPEKITVLKKGKIVNVQEEIQAANVDLEIKPTLEKYGMVPNMLQQIATVPDELAEINSLGDVLEMNKQAEALYMTLPADFREKVGSAKNLLANGTNIIKSLQEKANASSSVNNVSTVTTTTSNDSKIASEN